MLGKITKSAVDKLEPGSGWLWDTGLVGFGVRNQLRRPHYYVRFRLDGRQRFVTIGPHGAWTPETARREAQRLLGIVATGIDPAQPIAEGDSFGVVADRFLTHQRVRLKPRSIEEAERYLRQHAQPLHSMPIGSITRRDVAEVLGRIEAGSGPVARNRFRSTLSVLFAWCMTEGLIEANPVVGTAKADENGGRERVLSEAEIRSLWRACANGSDFSRIVRLLLLTGCRRNEVGHLEWREVNLAEATLTLPAERVKNGREHCLPLSKQAMALLNAEVSSRQGRVFPDVGSWAKEKYQLDARLGIAHFVLHDLRRSAATWMAELGVAPHIVEAVLNHYSGHRAGVAGIYSRAKYLAPMREALQLWADHVDRICK
jgi:integrase